MAPDINCDRPREKFNLSEKLIDYGGMAASMRLERLMSSNFRFTELKPEDKEMLRYIAQTTVWVPAEIEGKLGQIYDTTSSFFGLAGEKLNESEQLAIEDIEKRLKVLRGVVDDYPSEIHLKLDKKLPDGAFSRFGGLILISERFLNGLEDSGSGADFLLAHEVSHIYKRHAIKNIQYKLISSEEGWGLAKSLLVRARSGTKIVFEDVLFAVQTLPELIDFVRNVQVQFLKDQEFEADACSNVWLKAENIPQNEAWKNYQTVLGSSSTYSAEHPSSVDREARFFQKSAATLGAAQVGIDKGAVKKGGKELIKNARKEK